MRGEHHERIASAGTKAADSRQVQAIPDELERKRPVRIISVRRSRKDGVRFYESKTV